MVHHKCTVLVCEKRTVAKGWCWAHYRRNLRHGDPHWAEATWHLKPPPPQRLTEAQRFWTKVDFSGPPPEYRPELGSCWPWTGSTTGAGYGKFYGTNNPDRYAHRWAYEFCAGPIPEELELDHLCRTVLCVRPDHLEAVTHQENVQRSPIHFAQRTHCPQGHPYDEANTRIVKYERGGKGRLCRECGRHYSREYYRRRKKEEGHLSKNSPALEGSVRS